MSKAYRTVDTGIFFLTGFRGKVEGGGVEFEEYQGLKGMAELKKNLGA